jgi:hypothetical protein
MFVFNRIENKYVLEANGLFSSLEIEHLVSIYQSCITLSMKQLERIY